VEPVAPLDQVGQLLRDPHQRDELRRQQERGRDEEREPRGEAEVAAGRDQLALRDRRGGRECEEREPVAGVRGRRRERRETGRDGGRDDGEQEGAPGGPLSLEGR